MLSFIKKPSQTRFIEFRDGQFIETFQTKESCYLATHEQTKLLSSTLSVPSQTIPTSNARTEASPTTSHVLPTNRWMISAFVAFLILVAYVVFRLGLSWLYETQDYVSHLQPPLLNEGFPFFNLFETAKDSMVDDFKYSLDLHHQINGCFEQGKETTVAFNEGLLSLNQRNQAFNQLIGQLDELILENEEKRMKITDKELQVLYEGNTWRLQHYRDVLTKLQTVSDSVEIVTMMNQGIHDDTLVFQSQIEQFKMSLRKMNISYQEFEGTLSFEMPMN